MSDEMAAASHETTNAIALAAHLLTVAAENSKTVEEDIALPITTAIEAAEHATSFLDRIIETAKAPATPAHST
jgi:hypothetical protein